jgi:predicted XRE-type DNA-binding protein
MDNGWPCDAHRRVTGCSAADTKIAAADFSRIRTVKLDRFTIDRLMNILERLNRHVEVRIKVNQARRP